MIELATDRLILRPLQVEDAAQVQQLFPVWSVVRLLAKTFAWPYPPDGVLTYYRDFALPGMVRGEEWHWTLRLKSEPEQVIGAIGLFLQEGSNRGFWLGEHWQRQGLMTEACSAINDYWFDTLHRPLMRVKKAAQNEASRKISQSEGMRLAGLAEDDYIGGRFVTELWEMTATQWAARRQHTTKRGKKEGA